MDWGCKDSSAQDMLSVVGLMRGSQEKDRGKSLKRTQTLDDYSNELVTAFHELPFFRWFRYQAKIWTPAHTIRL